MPKPRIFIGSSKEHSDVAHVLQELLDDDFEVTVWEQGVFGLSTFTLPELVEQARRSDFGVFVFADDDIVRSRGTQASIARDNVVLEFGLFSGVLGVDRCFIVRPRRTKLHLPTDVLGMTVATYDTDRSDGISPGALGAAAHKIRTAAARNSRRPTVSVRSDLVSGFELLSTMPWDQILSQTRHTFDFAVYYWDSWINTHFDALLTLFGRANVKVTAFVGDPEVPDVMRELKRYFPGYSSKELANKVTRTGQRLDQIRARAKAPESSLEVRYVQHPLSYSVQVVDDRDLFISPYEMYREDRIGAPAVRWQLNASEAVTEFWAKERRGLIESSKVVIPAGA